MGDGPPVRLVCHLLGQAGKPRVSVQPVQARHRDNHRQPFFVGNLRHVAVMPLLVGPPQEVGHDRHAAVPRVIDPQPSLVDLPDHLPRVLIGLRGSAFLVVHTEGLQPEGLCELRGQAVARTCIDRQGLVVGHVEHTVAPPCVGGLVVAKDLTHDRLRLLRSRDREPPHEEVRKAIVADRTEQVVRERQSPSRSLERQRGNKVRTARAPPAEDVIVVEAGCPEEHQIDRASCPRGERILHERPDHPGINLTEGELIVYILHIHDYRAQSACTSMFGQLVRRGQESRMGQNNVLRTLLLAIPLGRSIPDCAAGPTHCTRIRRHVLNPVGSRLKPRLVAIARGGHLDPLKHQAVVRCIDGYGGMPEASD